MNTTLLPIKNISINNQLTTMNGDFLFTTSPFVYDPVTKSVQYKDYCLTLTIPLFSTIDEHFFSTIYEFNGNVCNITYNTATNTIYINNL